DSRENFAAALATFTRCGPAATLNGCIGTSARPSDLPSTKTSHHGRAVTTIVPIRFGAGVGAAVRTGVGSMRAVTVGAGVASITIAGVAVAVAVADTTATGVGVAAGMPVESAPRPPGTRNPTSTAVNTAPATASSIFGLGPAVSFANGTAGVAVFSAALAASSAGGSGFFAMRDGVFTTTVASGEAALGARVG